MSFYHLSGHKRFFLIMGIKKSYPPSLSLFQIPARNAGDDICTYIWYTHISIGIVDISIDIIKMTLNTDV